MVVASCRGELPTTQELALDRDAAKAFTGRISTRIFLCEPVESCLTACPHIPPSSSAHRAGSALALHANILSRGWRVIATARSDAAKLEALEKSAKGNLRIEHVDIADTDGVAELRQALKGEKLDLLFSLPAFPARCRSRCMRSRPTRPRGCS